MEDRRWEIGRGVRFLHPICHLRSAVCADCVGQLHHVIEKIVATAHVENRELTGIGTGDWLELFDALKFALEGPIVIERRAMHDFQRDERTSQVAREPDFAISPPPDRTQQLVIGNGQRRARDHHCNLLRH